MRAIARSRRDAIESELAEIRAGFLQRARDCATVTARAKPKGGVDMAKLAVTDIPKRTTGRKSSLTDKQVKQAVADLVGSVDWEPHSFTDGEVYEQYGQAAGRSRSYVAAAAQAENLSPLHYATRVWERNGKNEDRKAKGEWLFAITHRSEPRKPRTRKGQEATAATS